MTGDNTNSWARRTVLKAAGTAGSAAALAGIASATPGRDPRSRENELIVGVSAATSMSATEASVQSELPGPASVTHRNEDLGYFTVELPDEAAARAGSAIAEAIERKTGVRYVEENATFHALATPDDPKLADQYAPQQVRAPSAWDTTFGSDSVTVAVVDQGVKYDHPDLESRFGSNEGTDFVDSDGDPYPDSMSDEYHGTHVAGIASATTDNGTGVAGISDSTLLSGRALSEEGSGSTTDIADAVKWAADQGADIVNLSLGGGGYTDTMKNAVQYAVDNGTLPIAAAGNDGSSSVSYPAAYDECVAVSAVDENEDIADFSQYGSNLDVAAPGVDVLSTWTEYQSAYGGEYNEISGTSMACPAAAGVAALGKAAESGLSPTQLRNRLKNTAVDIGLSEQKQGSGRVDALNIVEAGGGGGDGGDDNEAPTVSIDASSATVTAGDAVTFDGSGSSDSDGSISTYEWSFGDGTSASGEVVSHTYSESGDYSAGLTVTDDDDATSTDSVAVTVEPDDGGDGGDCGDASAGGSADGYLYGYYDSADYTYAGSLENPCQITVSLDGPASADFDLYVTLDGRTPSAYDYDKRSITQDSQEQVLVDDVSSGQEIGILVDSYSGSGSYTVSVEELGQ